MKKWLKRIWLNIWKKIISVFSNRQMEIEQILTNWFDETYNLLEKHSQEDRQEIELERTVNASISVVENYLWSILKLLDKREARQYILPAQALLRCLYQLTSRITWILLGSTDSERSDRLKQLEKKSRKDQIKLTQRLLTVFEDDKRQNTKDVLNRHKNDLESMKKRVDVLESCVTQNMPKQIKILKEVFEGEYGVPKEGPCASELIPIRGWPDLHKAVHPDYLVLNFTISNLEDGLTYYGDIKENVDDLKYECCVCVHRFLKEIYKFYGFVNFDKIDNDFRELGNAVVSR